MSAHTPIATPPDRADDSDSSLPSTSELQLASPEIIGDQPIDRAAELEAVHPDHYLSDRERQPTVLESAHVDNVPPALARVLGGIGRLFITIGVLLLLFAGFQLWGTGLAESRAQDELADRFEDRLAEQAQLGRDGTAQPAVRLTAGPGFDALDPTIDEDPAATDSAPPTTSSELPQATSPTETAAEPIEVPAPEVGTPIGTLNIPAIGVDKTIVEGTTRDALRSGPGHYESTPLPGRVGNTAIAGHRTTHGAPFFDLDLLVPGDEIHVETLEGTATYRVEAHDDGVGGAVGHLIVDPSEVGVIADKGDNRLTLTACHPKYSAKERIIVTAVLVTDPLAPLTVQAPLIAPLESPDLPGPAATQATETPAPVTGATDATDVAEATAAIDGSATEVDSITAPLTPRAEQLLIDQLGVTLDDGIDAAQGLGFAGDPNDTVAASLGWQQQFLSATLLWAAFTGLIAAAGWVVGRLWRRWPAYAMAVPPFSLSLFYCFSNLEKFLPAV